MPSTERRADLQLCAGAADCDTRKLTIQASILYYIIFIFIKRLIYSLSTIQCGRKKYSRLSRFRFVGCVGVLLFFFNRYMPLRRKYRLLAPNTTRFKSIQEVMSTFLALIISSELILVNECDVYFFSLKLPIDMKSQIIIQCKYQRAHERYSICFQQVNIPR